MGLVTEVVPPGAHLERALALAEGLARFPQETMLADRRAAIEGLGLPLAEGLALEAQAARRCSRPARAARRASPPARAAAAPAPAPSAREGGPRERAGAVCGDERFAVTLCAMAYFVTGATGFIGRRLVERLLEQRQGKIYVLVREGSAAKLDELVERWSAVAGPSAAERVCRSSATCAGRCSASSRSRSMTCAARSRTSSISPPCTT